MDNKSSVIGFFLYFWMFQIAAFIVFYFMGLVTADSSVKVVGILFLITSAGYTFLYFVKKNGDKKRAARKAAAAASKQGKKKRK